MDKYVISEEEEVYDAEPPFPESMKSDVKVMELHKNTKFGNIIDYVNKLFEDETIRRVIFRGVGDAADKCVSCVEVYKRKRQEELYQWTALSTAKRVTYWDPLVKGMNRLKVTVDTPVIFIMLSRDPYPVELQCMSMQQSSNNQKKIPPKSGPSSSAKRGGTRKQQQQQRGGRTNKWARPAKAAKDTQAQENREILEKLEKLP
uniref:Alba domain-containing protein n=1 Tax=Haemonchus contortus TaxID=6289 RepID=A0A7I4YDG3_HAECO|nr:Alba domain containing protein [Haemonchus contortus]